MNCKQGDLAIIVRTTFGVNVGKIVNCLRLATNEEIKNEGFPFSFGPAWVTDVKLTTTFDTVSQLCPDKYLRPIRPSEGQDETLQWKDVPTKETV